MSQQSEILKKMLAGIPVDTVAAQYGMSRDKAKTAALLEARKILRKGFWKSRPGCFEEVMFMRGHITARLNPSGNAHKLFTAE